MFRGKIHWKALLVSLLFGFALIFAAVPTVSSTTLETSAQTVLLKKTKEPKPTKVPKPTDVSTTISPTPIPSQAPTNEPKPTKEPKPTNEPKPTKEPKPTNEPKPTKVPKCATYSFTYDTGVTDSGTTCDGWNVEGTYGTLHVSCSQNYDGRSVGGHLVVSWSITRTNGGNCDGGSDPTRTPPPPTWTPTTPPEPTHTNTPPPDSTPTATSTLPPKPTRTPPATSTPGTTETPRSTPPYTTTPGLTSTGTPTVTSGITTPSPDPRVPCPCVETVIIQGEGADHDHIALWAAIALLAGTNGAWMIKRRKLGN